MTLLVKMELLLSGIPIRVAAKQVLDVHLPGFKVALELVHVEGEAGEEGQEPESGGVLVDELQGSRAQLNDLCRI